MVLNAPFIIGSRLLPCLKVGDSYISLQLDRCEGGRFTWRYFLDIDGKEYTNNDLEAGFKSTILAFKSLLEFLSACGESYQYRISSGKTKPDPDSNESLFPTPIPEWCYLHYDELSMLALEIEENPDCLKE